MKKILRYLMGRKEASPSPQQRLVSAHELALKAVMRRRSGEGEKGEAEARATSESPVVAEQLVSINRPETGPDGGVPPLRSKTERRAQRKQGRRLRNFVAEQEASAGEQQAIGPGGEVPALRSKRERQAERKQRRRQRSLVAEREASAGVRQETDPGR